MVQDQDIQVLQQELESLQSSYVAGTLQSQQLWGVMQRTSVLLEDARGTRFEDVLGVILNLLNSIRQNCSNQKQLNHVKNNMKPS